MEQPILGQTRLLLAVVSSPSNEDRRDMIRRLWKRDVAKFAKAWTVVFVIGLPGRPSRLVGDILYVDTEEAYEYLPRKTYRLIEFFARDQNYDFLFKTDDDCYLNVRELRRFSPGTLDYFGQEAGPKYHKPDYHFGRTTGAFALDTSPYVGPWASGSGYGLTKAAAEAVLEQLTWEHAKDLIFEDKMVGDAMRQTALRRQLFRRWNAVRLAQFATYEVDDRRELVPSSVKFVAKPSLYRRKVFHLGSAGGARPLYLVPSSSLLLLAPRLRDALRRAAFRRTLKGFLTRLIPH
jgi:hypothetical protein